MSSKCESGAVPQVLRRITMPQDVYLAYEDIAADLRKKADNELVAELITPISVAQKVLKTFAARQARSRKRE